MTTSPDDFGEVDFGEEELTEEELADDGSRPVPLVPESERVDPGP